VVEVEVEAVISGRLGIIGVVRPSTCVVSMYVYVYIFV
jgi:hypothetical protein